jgi:hypothetical protein
MTDFHGLLVLDARRRHRVILRTRDSVPAQTSAKLLPKLMLT